MLNQAYKYGADAAFEDFFKEMQNGEVFEKEAFGGLAAVGKGLLGAGKFMLGGGGAASKLVGMPTFTGAMGAMGAGEGNRMKGFMVGYAGGLAGQAGWAGASRMGKGLMGRAGTKILSTKPGASLWKGMGNVGSKTPVYKGPANLLGKGIKLQPGTVKSLTEAHKLNPAQVSKLMGHSKELTKLQRGVPWTLKGGAGLGAGMLGWTAMDENIGKPVGQAAYGMLAGRGGPQMPSIGSSLRQYPQSSGLFNPARY